MSDLLVTENISTERLVIVTDFASPWASYTTVIAYVKTLWTADQRMSQQHITEIRPAPPGP